MVNRRGPSTEPWGSPDSETLQLDEESPSLTYRERFMRYEVIHCRAVPEIPKVD